MYDKYRVRMGKIHRLCRPLERSAYTTLSILSEAVAAWKEFMLPYKAKGAILVAPSIAQTPGSQDWLTQFIAKCPPAECGIDALALHWYQETNMMDYFKKYITDAHNNPAFGNLPVYVTEWAPTSVVEKSPRDGEAGLAAFIKEASEWMDQQDWILGYAVSTDIRFHPFPRAFIDVDLCSRLCSSSTRTISMQWVL